MPSSLSSLSPYNESPAKLYFQHDPTSVFHYCDSRSDVLTFSDCVHCALETRLIIRLVDEPVFPLVFLTSEIAHLLFCDVIDVHSALKEAAAERGNELAFEYSEHLLGFNLHPEIDPDDHRYLQAAVSLFAKLCDKVSPRENYEVYMFLVLEQQEPVLHVDLIADYILDLRWFDFETEIQEYHTALRAERLHLNSGALEHKLAFSVARDRCAAHLRRFLRAPLLCVEPDR